MKDKNQQILTSVTILDVAREAGVSYSTVSRALSEYEFAKEITIVLPTNFSHQPGKGILAIGVLVEIYAGQNTPINPLYGAVFGGTKQGKCHNPGWMYSSLPVGGFLNGIEYPLVSSGGHLRTRFNL